MSVRSKARDRWRYRCPHGDTGWRSQSSPDATAPVYCETCRDNGRDPFHEELIDMKEDRMISL